MRRGQSVSDADLNGPAVPDELAYLRHWLYELHGRSGVGMSGIAPLTYTTVADWARLTDQSIEPYEVDALMMLDGVLLHPEPTSESARPEAPAVRSARAWPTKKSALPGAG